jgi:hypothetical protein
MSSQNWIRIVIALVAGAAVGLIYGWIIDPVEYTDAAPNILRQDYRTDYVLMVAEAYQSEQDPVIAAQRLAILGSEPPAKIAGNAIEYARAQAFPPDEMTLLQGLLTAMQTYQPAGGPNP